MKKILLLFSLIGLLVSCQNTNQPTNNITNGFINGTGQTVLMGSEATIELFNKFNNAWLNRDYETMKVYISDNGIFRHADGSITNNAEEFIAHSENNYQESLASGEEEVWVTNFAFSVKPSASDDPEITNTQGEWVCARFTGLNAVYDEWYQFVDGKLVDWTSSKRELIK
tara:strand:+ start:231 stop:740 length:510 start_codon:yes stop_codon:yes gene_type:complete